MIEIRKHTGGEATFQLNLSRAALASAIPNYADRPSNVTTLDKYMHKCMDPDEPTIGLKNNNR